MYCLINEKEIPLHTPNHMIMFMTQKGAEECKLHFPGKLYLRYFYQVADANEVIKFYGEPLYWEYNKNDILREIFAEDGRYYDNVYI